MFTHIKIYLCVLCPCHRRLNWVTMPKSHTLRGIPMRANYLFTSESVSEGHPDKFVTEFPTKSSISFIVKRPRLGWIPGPCASPAKPSPPQNRVVIAGEVRLPSSLMKTDKNGNEVINPAKFKSAARKAIRDIGYEQDGFHGRRPRSTCSCTLSPPTLLRASTRLPTAPTAKALATRASCSVTPARKRRT